MLCAACLSHVAPCRFLSFLVPPCRSLSPASSLAHFKSTCQVYPLLPLLHFVLGRQSLEPVGPGIVILWTACAVAVVDTEVVDQAGSSVCSMGCIRPTYMAATMRSTLLTSYAQAKCCMLVCANIPGNSHKHQDTRTSYSQSQVVIKSRY